MYKYLIIFLLGFGIGNYIYYQKTKLPWYVYLSCLDAYNTGVSLDNFIHCHNLAVDVFYNKE